MTNQAFQAYMINKNPKVVAYVRKKKIMKLTKLLLINGLILASVALTAKGMRQTELVPILYALAAIAGVFVCIFTAPRGLLFGKSYTGRIERADIETRMASNENNIRKITTKNFLVLSIRDEEGTLKKIYLDTKYKSCYLAGDEVGLYNGILYPFLLSASKERPTVCWWCGSIKRPLYVECIACGREFFAD